MTRNPESSRIESILKARPVKGQGLTGDLADPPKHIVGKKDWTKLNIVL